jgi:hypothetical protein
MDAQLAKPGAIPEIWGTSVSSLPPVRNHESQANLFAFAKGRERFIGVVIPKGVLHDIFTRLLPAFTAFVRLIG